MRWLRWISAGAVVLCFIVIVFGAFVRLSNAGLSCPDWPTCYGRLAWPVNPADIAQANAEFERPVEVSKAWREQVHRFLAGALMLATFAIAWLCWRARRRHPDVPWRVACAAAVLIVFQALLGMWTVTLKLKPVIVLAHLAGGMATLALLVWIATRLQGLALGPPTVHPAGSELRESGPQIAGEAGGIRRVAILIAIVLLAIQIALGGWTSVNYAALACGFDFPKCLGEWWPATDFRNAFVLWRGVGVDYEGGVLDGPARVAIHIAHRLFAIVVALYLAGLSIGLLRNPAWRRAGSALLFLLTVQLVLGIGNVSLGLALPNATLHNAGAAALLALLVWMLSRPPGFASTTAAPRVDPAT